MVVTDNATTAARVRRLRDQAFAPGKRFVHHELGFNYRMTNLRVRSASHRCVASTSWSASARTLRYQRLLPTFPAFDCPPKSHGLGLL